MTHLSHATLPRITVPKPDYDHVGKTFTIELPMVPALQERARRGDGDLRQHPQDGVRAALAAHGAS